MRLVNLYQVYDLRARNCMGPIFASQNEVPIARELQGHVNNPETIIGQHPTDFHLIKLGTQDLDTGRIDALPEVEFILEIANLKAKTD